MIFGVLKYFFLFFWAFRSSLLNIVGELAGGASMAVAVGVSDRWHVTRNWWQVTCDISFYFILYGIDDTNRTHSEIQCLLYAEL